MIISVIIIKREIDNVRDARDDDNGAGGDEINEDEGVDLIGDEPYNWSVCDVM